MAEPSIPVCVGCKVAPALPGFATPLCPTCREMLARYPVPMWMRVSAGLIVLVMIYSAVTRLPHALRADMAFDRGKIAAAKGDYPAARSQLAYVLAEYPSAGEVLSILAIAASHAGDRKTADASLQRLKTLAKNDDSQAVLLASTLQQITGK